MAGESEKILIIVYYWPPSGGSGVQRWVKLAKYLAKQGIEVHVLTVDEKKASYLQTDESLLEDVHPAIHVYKTSSFEIINIFAKLFGKEKVPTAGFYNLDRKSLAHNLGLIIRSNLFIPDPRRGWNGYAYRKACEIINKEGITKVITSSPPHSTQLIGLKLKKKFGIEWIADLRDPWTDIFYYKLLRHSFSSRIIDRIYEKSVIKNSDLIFTVSPKLKDLYLSKTPGISPEKVNIIPNGYDEADFHQIENPYISQDFVIGYTGTISEQYKPEAFLRAFSNFIRQSTGNIYLEITGTVSQGIIEYAEHIGLKNIIRVKPVVPHEEIPSLLMKMSVLLLVIPSVDNAGGILTGKLFEYLASKRPIILLGPKEGDAASILSECGAGETFEWNDEKGIFTHLSNLKKLHDSRNLFLPENDNLIKYSRAIQAQQVRQILFG